MGQEPHQRYDGNDRAAGRRDRAAPGDGPARPTRPSRAQATFALRLDPAVVAEVRRLAAVRAVGPTQLVRSWVLERLEVEHGRDVPGGTAAPTAAPGRSDSIVEQVLAELRPRVDEVVRQALARAGAAGSDTASPAPIAPPTARPRP